MSEHWPGPWEAQDDDFHGRWWSIYDADGELVARVMGNTESFDASAYLIATAPELLAALKGFYDAVRDVNRPNLRKLAQARSLAGAAISKAEGI